MAPISRYVGETPILPHYEAKFDLEGLAGVLSVSGAKGAVLST